MEFVKRGSTVTTACDLKNLLTINSFYKGTYYNFKISHTTFMQVKKDYKKTICNLLDKIQTVMENYKIKISTTTCERVIIISMAF